MIEMISDARTNAGKPVMSNNACARRQRSLHKRFSLLIDLMLCVKTLHTFLPFVKQGLTIVLELIFL